MTTQLLLLEDDPAIARTVAYALERDGMAVTHSLLVHDARQQMRSRRFDLLVLDVGLPDGSGLDLLREVRHAPATVAVPVLMLSAHGEEIDRVLGLVALVIFAALVLAWLWPRFHAEAGFRAAVAGMVVVAAGVCVVVAAAFSRWALPEGRIGLILTRQNVPVLEGTSGDGVARGGYVLGGASRQDVQDADVIIIATGSEVHLAVEAAKTLNAKDIRTYVVSMPCVEWFEAQPQEYRDSVLPPDVSARVAVEAGVSQSWYKYVGDTGEIISIERYGESADDKTLFREFGFTPEAIVAAAERAFDN
jgi:CheY-like chemotaxis protein